MLVPLVTSSFVFVLLIIISCQTRQLANRFLGFPAYVRHLIAFTIVADEKIRKDEADVGSQRLSLVIGRLLGSSILVPKTGGRAISDSQLVGDSPVILNPTSRQSSNGNSNGSMQLGMYVLVLIQLDRATRRLCPVACSHGVSSGLVLELLRMIPTPVPVSHPSTFQSVLSDAGHHHHTSQQSPVTFSNPGTKPDPQALVRLRRPMLNNNTYHCPIFSYPVLQRVHPVAWTLIYWHISVLYSVLYLQYIYRKYSVPAQQAAAVPGPVRILLCIPLSRVSLQVTSRRHSCHCTSSIPLPTQKRANP